MKEPYTSRIAKAHEAGHLFAHMFEFPFEKKGPRTDLMTNMLAVMAKTPGSLYASANDEAGWRHIFTPTEHGLIGLATTALNKRYPVRLWTECSNVGLLMDTAKPVLVSSGDNYTEVDEGKINCLARDRFPELMQMQRVDFGDSITLLDEFEGRVANAESTLSKMWEMIKGTGWKKYFEMRPDFPGMNEINVAVTLPDICGIVIHNDPTKKGRSYQTSVKKAVALKKLLIESHPESFDASLPIMEYKLTRGLQHETGRPILEPIAPAILEAIEHGKPLPQQHL